MGGRKKCVVWGGIAVLNKVDREGLAENVTCK